MNVDDMSGRVLNWVMSACVDSRRVKIDPATWNPTENWDQVTEFWSDPNAGVRRVHPTTPRPVSCIGDGAFEATRGNFVARGATQLDAVCRVMVLQAFGSEVDVPAEFQR